jgi:phospholipid/cholesterol/gamma-HCH transport system substrate-binding protein
MQHTTTQDTLVGLFVVAGIVGLFFLAMQVSNLSSFTEQDSYTVTARFQNSGGLKVKSPVSAAGVKIGRVTGISFDPKTYESVVQLSIDSRYNSLPEQYVNLDAGGSDEYLKNGGKIDITNSAIILEKALGQFLFKSAAEKK